MIEFNFLFGIMAIPEFIVTVRINPKFANLFNKEDMAQLITLRIDSALLARK